MRPAAIFFAMALGASATMLAQQGQPRDAERTPGVQAGQDPNRAAFITAKFLGTIFVLVALQGVAFWRVRLAGLVAIPLAAFQLSLVVHLLFAPG